jgi:hypothetical protein
MATVAMETTKKHEKFKVLGIGWNFLEIVSDMCTHNFEAKKFQNTVATKNVKNLKCSELDEA